MQREIIYRIYTLVRLLLLLAVAADQVDAKKEIRLSSGVSSTASFPEWNVSRPKLKMSFFVGRSVIGGEGRNKNVTQQSVTTLKQLFYILFSLFYLQRR